MAKYHIRKMLESEVQIAVEWAKNEGWNPGLDDAHCFYQADPNGFFVGCLDDVPVAVGSAVIYSDNYAFCGLYIVKPELRHKGYGIKLTEERLKYAGDRITGIDGVLENVSKYERIGYVVSHKQIRFEWVGTPAFSILPHVVDIHQLPFNELRSYDNKYFPAPRPKFLHSWTHQKDGYALAYVDNAHIMGYGVIRKCFQGYKIGPLFAESLEISQALFEALCAKAGAKCVYLDIPEPNQNAQTLVRHYFMQPKFEVIRMYRNGFPDVNLDAAIYGVTSFELG